MGLRKLRFCRSCKRKFTPMNQALVQSRPGTSVEPTVPAPVEPIVQSTSELESAGDEDHSPGS